MQPPLCPYCHKPAQFERSSACVYARDYGPIWRCVPCKAWVGCHKGTNRPLGRLADKQLRGAKMSAHTHFDRLWKRGGMRRYEAYGWLAEQMGLTRDECHIGMFSVEQCRRVAELCHTVNAK